MNITDRASRPARFTPAPTDLHPADLEALRAEQDRQQKASDSFLDSLLAQRRKLTRFVLDFVI